MGDFKNCEMGSFRRMWLLADDGVGVLVAQVLKLIGRQRDGSEIRLVYHTGVLIDVGYSQFEGSVNSFIMCTKKMLGWKKEVKQDDLYARASHLRSGPKLRTQHQHLSRPYLTQPYVFYTSRRLLSTIAIFLIIRSARRPQVQLHWSALNYHRLLSLTKLLSSKSLSDLLS